MSVIGGRDWSTAVGQGWEITKRLDVQMRRLADAIIEQDIDKIRDIKIRIDTELRSLNGVMYDLELIGIESKQDRKRNNQ